MRIVNKTHWQTAPIREIVSRVAAVELEADARKRLVVTLLYRRSSRRMIGGYCRGHATLGKRGVWTARDMTLTLPRDWVDPISLAKVAAHEMAHLRGFNHTEMKGARYSYQHPDWRAFYAWAAAYRIERQPAPPRKTPEERRQTKLDAARAKVVSWERAAKRAANKIKRWRLRARTLERTILKAAQPPAPPDPQV